MKLCVAVMTFFISAIAFANPSDLNCYAKTWKGKTLTLSIGTNSIGVEDGFPATTTVQISIDDTIITTYYPDQVKSEMKNFGTNGDVFMLNVTEAKNYRGSLTYYFPEQDGTEQLFIEVQNLKVKSLKKPGYVINVQNLEMVCPVL